MTTNPEQPNPMRARKIAEEAAAREAEENFHRTARRNALGGYIGCEGPDCWALIQEIGRANNGLKIQGAP